MSKSKFITKQVAIASFKEVLPDLPHKDKVAIRCAWNDFTDGLHRDGQISDYQVRIWTNPFDK